MITVRRAAERHHVRRGKHELWLTFSAQEHTGPLGASFGALAAFNEMRLSCGVGFATHPRDEAEILTYVYEGSLAQQDSTGNSGVIHAGEFQRVTTGRGVRYRETNASRTDCAHLFRIFLHPLEVGLDYAHEQKRLVAAQRRNVLCVVASPDGRKGSLHIHQDTLIYSSILDCGHHLVHELLPQRTAWLHIVCGEATLNDIVLTQGDGVGIAMEPSVSLTVQENAEILLIDLGAAPSSFGKDDVP
jgi:quercetin 2,3-dioxygenase